MGSHSALTLTITWAFNKYLCKSSEGFVIVAWKMERLLFLWTLAYLVRPLVCVNECMSGKEISCFNCDSNDDPRCLDPFNFTSHARDMPATMECEGCCVKLVQHRGTPYENVRRTCTDTIDINLFMADHVCMTEGGKDGIMCFCEENRCNGATTNTITGLAILATLAN